jgi:hypothetical protein
VPDAVFTVLLGICATLFEGAANHMFADLLAKEAVEQAKKGKQS